MKAQAASIDSARLTPEPDNLSDPEEELQFEAYALDYHAIECVFGPEEDLQPPEAEHRGWRAAAQSWLWRHRYGYPAIRTRKEALLARLGAREAPGVSAARTAPRAAPLK